MILFLVFFTGKVEPGESAEEGFGFFVAGFGGFEGLATGAAQNFSQNSLDSGAAGRIIPPKSNKEYAFLPRSLPLVIVTEGESVNGPVGSRESEHGKRNGEVV